MLSTWDISVTTRKAAAIRALKTQSNKLQLAGIRAEKNEIGLQMDSVKEEYDEKQKVKISLNISLHDNQLMRTFTRPIQYSN